MGVLPHCSQLSEILPRVPYCLIIMFYMVLTSKPCYPSQSARMCIKSIVFLFIYLVFIWSCAVLVICLVVLGLIQAFTSWLNRHYIDLFIIYLLVSVCFQGISFSSIMYVTKQNMANAVSSMTKHLEQVQNSLAVSIKYFSQLYLIGKRVTISFIPILVHCASILVHFSFLAFFFLFFGCVHRSCH